MTKQEIENRVANGDTDARRLRRQRAPEYPERKILNWKVGARPVRRFDPTTQVRIVRLVDGHLSIADWGLRIAD